MGKAYGYCRCSTDKQGELGIDSQKKCITDLWEKHLKKDYPELEFFIDMDVSARQNDFTKRPQAKSLALRLTKDDALIFSKLDRGFRSLRDMLNQLHFWDKTGVRVFCPDFGIGQIYDSKSMMGRMALICFGMVAEMEGMYCSQRTHDFNRSQEASGRPIGTPWYGFKNVRRGAAKTAKNKSPAYLQPEPKEQEVARFIVASMEKGISMVRIAKHLTTHGFTTRTGKRIRRENVHFIYQRWKKIVEFERLLPKTRGYKLREWEFMSPTGRVLINFELEHLIPKEDKASGE